MSQYYQMALKVSEYKPDKRDEIIAAAESEWPFEDWYEPKPERVITASGEGAKGAGCSESDLADLIAKAIFKANGEACQVEVVATCLEELPSDTYIRDESDYARLVEGEEK